MAMLRLCRWGVFALVMLIPAHAAAQRAAADRLFKEGRTLLAKRHFAAACMKFQASNEIEESIGALLNLAKCRELNRQPATAIVVYRRAIEKAHALGDESRAKYAHAQIVELQPTVSYLTIDIPEPARHLHLVVTRNGDVVADDDLNRRIAVDPGNHFITARIPRVTRWNIEVAITSFGQHAMVTVPVLVAPEPVVQPSVATSQPSIERSIPAPSSVTRATPRWLSWPVIGTGAFMAAAGGWLYRSANHREDEYDDLVASQCGAMGCTPEQRMAMKPVRDRARNRDLAAKATLIAGGVYMAVGALMYYVSAPAPSGDRSAFVTPTLGADEVGIMTNISF